jgi:D-serine deaminase-like pyridoxal phosphate-dependent protein
LVYEFPEIDTPALIIEKSRMERNLLRIQTLTNNKGIKFRPHIKTHKMPVLAIEQTKQGAVGIAVAKLSEAEIMFKHGLDDIQIANIITGRLKIERLKAVLTRVKRITCCVDSPENVIELSESLENTGLILEVFIKINSGLDRAGLNEFPKILQLAKLITELNNIKLAGILTHAGQGYSAENIDELKSIGKYEGLFMVDIARRLNANRIDVPEISVGSTPTAPYCSMIKGVTELRAGNYIFNDMIQVSLGSANIEDCSLTILSAVISIPSAERVIIDAGTKALGREKGAHGLEKVEGFGFLSNKNGVLTRMSEEHGIIIHNGESFKLGERIRIIPNHACVVSNNFDIAYLVDGQKVLKEIKIEARGMMT